MLWEALTSTGDLGRMHQIAKILIKFGFGDVVRRLGIGSLLEKSQRLLPSESTRQFIELSPPERVRRALEELGPTFIKLGQILATRRDLFGPEWIEEFEKLQDEVPPVPFSEVEAQIRIALDGRGLREVFAWVEETPLAAASIAQVHAAELLDGTSVVVKVRRPGIRKVVESDLRLLKHFVKLLEFEFPELRRYHLPQVVRQFTLSLRRELDLATEGRQAERIAGILADDERIVIPKIYWECTSERINVQSRIEGISGRHLEEARQAGLDLKQIAKTGAEAVLKMVLEAGYFHADPHPGNVFFLPGNRLALIDFGMIGRLTDERREQVIDLLLAVVTQDAQGFTEILLEWSTPETLHHEVLVAEVDLFLSQYGGVPLKQLDFSRLIGDFMTLLRDHELVLPPDLALLSKTFITLDGLGRALDPDFVMVEEIRPFVERLTTERYLPKNLAKRGAKSFKQAISVLFNLPKDLQQFIRGLRKGYLGIHIEINHLERFERRLNAIANRLSMATVISALIIGSSIVMTVPSGPEGLTLFGLPAFGVLGFIAAVLGGVWLLFSIWASSKK
jgi:ubiquinone biosynthesis protein